MVYSGYICGKICLPMLLQGERSLENLKSTYFSMKDNVFQQQSKLISLICDTNALEETIKGMFGTEKRMSHVTKPK